MLALISRIRVEGLLDNWMRRHLRRGQKMEFLFSIYVFVTFILKVSA